MQHGDTFPVSKNYPFAVSLADTLSQVIYIESPRMSYCTQNPNAMWDVNLIDFLDGGLIWTNLTSFLFFA